MSLPAYRQPANNSGVLDAGWRCVTVETVRGSPTTLRNRLRGWRKQYALRLHVTFGAQRSKVDSHPAGLFSLWEPAQAIVLLSCTKLGRDMFFVGSPEETAKAIVNVLRQTSQYFEYMRHILNAFLASSSSDSVAGGNSTPPVLCCRPRAPPISTN